MFIVVTTSIERQKRYREHITRGERKRLQLVISREQANKLNEICTKKGISKTDFLRRAIDSWTDETLCRDE